MNAARIRSAGFTLVEVLIALTVVAIGLGAAVAVVNQSVYNAYSLQQKTLASWVAENKLAEIRAAAAVPDFDEADGDSELGGRFWRWNAEVLETGVENVTRIEIGVASEEEPDVEIVRLIGFLGIAIPENVRDVRWEGEPQEAPGGIPQ